MLEKYKQLILQQAEKITFTESTHTYKCFDKYLTPVTNKIKVFQEPFDTLTIATAFAERNNVLVEDVIEAWEEMKNIACALGTDVHDFGERLFYNRDLKIEDGETNKEYKQQIKLFWNEIDTNKLFPLLAETKVFSNIFGFAGTFDILFYDVEKEGLIIADYKTNKDLYKNFRGKTLLEPFDNMLDTPFNMYKLQLSCYQIPLDLLNLKVLDRWIIHVTQEDYSILPCEDLTLEVKKAIVNYDNKQGLHSEDFISI